MSTSGTQPHPWHARGLPDIATLSRLATALLDAGGRVVWWSAGAADLFGFAADAAVGHDVRAAFPYGADQIVLTEALARAAEGQVWTGVVSISETAGAPLMCRFEPVGGAADTPGAERVLMTAARAPGDAEPFAAHGSALFNAATLIGSTLDLGQTARETVAVAVPGFAEAAAVFVLERLFEGDEPPGEEVDGSVMVRRLASAYVGADPDDWGSGLPGDEVVVHRAATPYARCVATGSPVLFDSIHPETAGAGFLAVPLKARGLVLGYAVFARSLMDFDERDVALAQEVAARAAVCIDNARLYRLERRTARALRGALLPPRPDAPPGLELAHRYLPASGRTQVGGDWYDMIPLPRGRMALVIGDAMGHDTMAAAAMVQLRTAAHTLADLDLPPEEVLRRLDRLAQTLADAHLATCLFVVCDPAAGTCDLACAGHVPPLVAYPDGRTERVTLPPGLPLGVGEARFETCRITLPPGATLVLCTDGLVERRGRDIDAGIEALRRTLAVPRRSLEATCQALMRTVEEHRSADDVTLLLARLTPQTGHVR
ncbi:MAG TPA: SpoIIE family protein phosphatase [Streptosporangiaceae bacterium]